MPVKEDKTRRYGQLQLGAPPRKHKGNKNVCAGKRSVDQGAKGTMEQTHFLAYKVGQEASLTTSYLLSSTDILSPSPEFRSSWPNPTMSTSQAYRPTPFITGPPTISASQPYRSSSFSTRHPEPFLHDKYEGLTVWLRIYLLIIFMVLSPAPILLWFRWSGRHSQVKRPAVRATIPSQDTTAPSPLQPEIHAAWTTQRQAPRDGDIDSPGSLFRSEADSNESGADQQPSTNPTGAHQRPSIEEREIGQQLFTVARQAGQNPSMPVHTAQARQMRFGAAPDLAPVQVLDSHRVTMPRDSPNIGHTAYLQYLHDYLQRRLERIALNNGRMAALGDVVSSIGMAYGEPPEEFPR